MTIVHSSLEMRSSFTTARFTEVSETRYGRKCHAVFGLSFDLFYLGSGLTIRVPDGFTTDGPSWPLWVDGLLVLIKKLMTWFGYEKQIPSLPDVHMVRSSALHDYLRERLLIPKFIGDYIFLTALKAEGCAFIFRWLAFGAVLMNFSRHRATNTKLVLTEQSEPTKE